MLKAGSEAAPLLHVAKDVQGAGQIRLSWLEGQGEEKAEGVPPLLWCWWGREIQDWFFFIALLLRRNKFRGIHWAELSKNQAEYSPR